MAAWCTISPFETPINHYIIVTDPSDNILAGVGLAERGRIRKLVVTSVPKMVENLNKLLKIVPETGEMRELSLSRLWFAPGCIDAAKYLYETIRWQWREKGTVLIAFSDTRSPAIKVFGLRPWTISTTNSLALFGPTEMPEERLVYYS